MPLLSVDVYHSEALVLEAREHTLRCKPFVKWMQPMKSHIVGWLELATQMFILP